MGPALTRADARRLTGGLAGAAALIAAVTVLSRVVGFGRWVAQANNVGATEVGDAYNSANVLPNVLFEVAAGGALAGAVVPLLAYPLARSIRADVDRIASALLGWALAVLVPLAVVVAVLSRPLVTFFLPTGTPEQLDLAGTFLAVFAVQIPLYGVGVVLSGVLHAHRRFLAPALAPLLSSLVVVAVYVTFGALTPGTDGDPAALTSAAVAVLAWGTTAGVAVMSLPLLWPVRRCGVRLRPVLSFPPGVAARARALALAGLGALVAQQLSVLTVLRLANDHGEPGTFSAFMYTQAVYLLPYAVLAVPLATAAFPQLSLRAANGDTVGFARLTALTTRAVILVSGAGAVALASAAPAVQEAFATFARGSVDGMGVALTAMAPGLLGFALIFHLSRVLYALERGRTAVLATASGWAVVTVVALVLVPWWTAGTDDQVAALSALGVSSSVGMTVAGVGLLLGVRRAAGPAATRSVARSVAVVVTLGVAGAWVARWLLARAGAEEVGSLADAVLLGGMAAVVAVLVLGAGAAVVDRRALGTLVPRRGGGGRGREGGAGGDGIEEAG